MDKVIIFNVPSDTKDKFAEICDKRGLSMSAYLRLLVTDELKKQDMERR